MAHWEYGSFVAVKTYEEEAVIAINGVVQDIRARHQSADEVLNEMGAEGWELVTILPVRPPSPDTRETFGGFFQFYLKRQR